MESIRCSGEINVTVCPETLRKVTKSYFPDLSDVRASAAEVPTLADVEFANKIRSLRRRINSK